MTREEEIRARREAATPGPWILIKDGRYEDHDECRIELPDDTIEFCRYENGEFAARAHTDIPYLLDENARLRAELEAANKAIANAIMLLEPTSRGYVMFRAARAELKEWCALERGLCAENGGAK